MMRFCFPLIVALSLGCWIRAEEATSPDKEKASAGHDQELRAIAEKVQELSSHQHYFEAIEELKKAEALAPDNAMLPNAEGSIYTAMRDFDHARECFERSLKLMPTNFEPKFNLAELLYVQGHFPESEAAFSALLKEYPKLREEVRHLTQFKAAVCWLKQDHIAEAEEASKNFTFMDDTPAYYFSKAAISFQKGNKDEAASWLKRAMRIFKPKENAPYFDTLMEAHWLPSLTVPQGEKAADEPAKEAKP
jgi:tetratricopeptide (TPR) repeat protein